MAVRSLARRAIVAAALLVIEAQATVLVLYGIPDLHEVVRVNGRYRRYPMHRNGFPCYEHLDEPEVVICRDPDGYWVVQTWDKAGTRDCYVHSAGHEALTPWAANPWMVWNGTAWEVKDSIRATKAEEPEEPLVKWTVAVLIYGALISAATVLAFAMSWDVQLRYQTYCLLADALTFAVACCVQGALHYLIYGLLLPKILGEEPPPDDQIEAGWYLLLPTFVFTALYMFLSFTGWKVQYSNALLGLTSTLGSRVVAMAGLHAYYMLYLFSLNEVSPELRIPTGETNLRQPAPIADAVTGAILFVVTFVMLRLYAWAACGIRVDRGPEPPKWPWATKEVVARVQMERGCTPCSAHTTTMLAPAQAKVRGKGWNAVIEDAEIDASSVILGFLLVSILLQCVVGEPLEFMVESAYGFSRKSADAFLPVALSLTLLAVYALYSIAKNPIIATDTMWQWPLQVARRVLVFAAVFALFGLVRWSFILYFGESPPLSRSSFVFALTVSAFALLFVVDKVLDRWRERWELKYIEDAMRLFTAALGLMLGYAFFLLLWESERTMVEHGPLHMLQGHQAAKDTYLGVAMLLLGALIAVCYFMSVLPAASRDQKDLEKDISVEREQLMSTGLFG